MRRLILFFVAACAIAVPAASAAPAKNSANNDSGVMCVLHAKLSAEGDTGSTSMDTGKAKIKVLADGTIEFKTKINNVDGETFVAAHIHQGAVGIAGPRRTALQWVDEREQDQAEQRRDTTRKHDRRGHLCRPERLLRQLPLDAIPGRLDPRPARLVPSSKGRAKARPFNTGA